MKFFDMGALRFSYYSQINPITDEMRLCFEPSRQSLKKLKEGNYPPQKVSYDLANCFDELFYEYRQEFDFEPLFSDRLDRFELRVRLRVPTRKSLLAAYNGFY